jgi:hypothetical protein
MKPSAYITEQIWFPCDTCGEQITHHSVHSCFVMNPDILPTPEDWKLICEMVKQTDLIVLLREEVTLMQKYLEKQNLREHFVTWRHEK